MGLGEEEAEVIEDQPNFIVGNEEDERSRHSSLSSNASAHSSNYYHVTMNVDQTKTRTNPTKEKQLDDNAINEAKERTEGSFIDDDDHEHLTNFRSNILSTPSKTRRRKISSTSPPFETTPQLNESLLKNSAITKNSYLEQRESNTNKKVQFTKPQRASPATPTSPGSVNPFFFTNSGNSLRPNLYYLHQSPSSPNLMTLYPVTKFYRPSPNSNPARVIHRSSSTSSLPVHTIHEER